MLKARPTAGAIWVMTCIRTAGNFRAPARSSVGAAVWFEPGLELAADISLSASDAAFDSSLPSAVVVQNTWLEVGFNLLNRRFTLSAVAGSTSRKRLYNWHHVKKLLPIFPS